MGLFGVSCIKKKRCVPKYRRNDSFRAHGKDERKSNTVVFTILHCYIEGKIKTSKDQDGQHKRRLENKEFED